MEGPNKHIEECIREYVNLKHSPYYAIMISGPWGVGKTHLIKSILQNLENIEYAYVSLYGAKNTEDIDLSILHSSFPILSSKSAKLAGKAGKAALKYLRIDGLIKPSDISSRSNEKIYIFDDLERCGMETSHALGYINEFVEHDGCKAIIIANEEKLPNREDFQDTREKLIGRTLEVQPDTTLLVNSLVANISSRKAKALLENNKNIITTIFNEAETKSFRVLQQAIWDFENLAEQLDEFHLENKDGTRAILKLFLAIAIEFKSGRINKEDIKTRPQLRWSLQKEKTKTALENSQSRFSESDLFDTILSNKVLIDILLIGRVIKEDLLQSINSSAYYASQSSEPAWRTVWHGTERDIEVFDAALKQLENELDEQKIEEPGIIIHAAGLYLWLSEIGQINKNEEDILNYFKNYVTDLYKAGRLKPAKKSERILGRRLQGYGGLGVMNIESSGMQDFTDFVHKLRNEAQEDLYPEFAMQLLEEMKTDASLFYRRINYTNAPDDNLYADMPILAKIDPGNFAKELCNINHKDRHYILAAIHERHSPNSKEELSCEIPWIAEVTQALQLKLDEMPPVHRWGLRGAIDHYLGSLNELKGD